jgi:hypothetical protein
LPMVHSKTLSKQLKRDLKSKTLLTSPATRSRWLICISGSLLRLVF